MLSEAGEEAVALGSRALDLLVALTCRPGTLVSKDELIEAGFVDGAGTFRIFTSIVVPAARPAMTVLAMLSFLTAWNDFFWPIIALSSQNPTIQVAFQSLATGYAPQQSVIMAGTLYGTGMIVVNPPFTLEAELNAILPALAKVLPQGKGGHRVEWIRGEA